MIFCENHCITAEGRVCIAHLAEGRVLDCPFKDKKEIQESNYKCQDYSPLKDKTF